jgi:ankyrin repeat protein
MALVQHQTPRLRKLLEAAKECKTVPLRRYLKAGGSPNALVDIDDITSPLLYVAMVNHHDRECEASLQLLLQHNNLNLEAVTADEDGMESTALILACDLDCCDIPLIALLQKGADPCHQTPKIGMSPLHKAAYTGQVDKCRLLLSASRRTLSLRDKFTATPLADAAHAVRVPVVKLLLDEYGADVQFRDAEGNTLLHIMKAAKQLPMLQYLLGRGDLDINAVNQRRTTALHSAAAAKTGAAVVQLLLQAGADASIKNINGHNALFAACKEGCAASVALLLGAPGMHTEMRADKGLTLLMCCCFQGAADTAQLLLERGAAVNAVNQLNSTALHLTAASGSAPTAALLLQHGADVHARDLDGCTALYYAADLPSVPLLQVLLSAAGSSALTRVSNDGATLLHAAAAPREPEAAAAAQRRSCSAEHAGPWLCLLRPAHCTDEVQAACHCAAAAGSWR